MAEIVPINNIDKHTKEKFRLIELSILYIAYVLFLTSVPFSGAIAGYASNVLILGMFGGYLLFRNSTLKILVKRINVAFVCALALVFTFGWAFNLHPYTVVLYTKIVFIAALFNRASFRLPDLVMFINWTYLIYAGLSYLMYLGLMPQISKELNQFAVHLFGVIEIKTLIGIEGSTASIDSYSGLVIIVNGFLNKKKSKYFWITLGGVSMLLTTRMTPLVALFASAFSYIFIRHRVVAISFLLGTMFGLIGVLVMLQINPNYKISFLGQNVEFWKFLVPITHARSLMWEKQFQNVLEYYDIFDYIFGYFEDEITHVRVFWGWYSDMINPHNSYIFLFFLSPFLLLYSYLIMLAKIFLRFSRKTFPVILFILTVAYTSQKVFVMDNPVYLYMLLFLLVGKYQFSEGSRLKSKHIPKC